MNSSQSRLDGSKTSNSSSTLFAASEDISMTKTDSRNLNLAESVSSVSEAISMNISSHSLKLAGSGAVVSDSSSISRSGMSSFSASQSISTSQRRESTATTIVLFNGPGPRSTSIPATASARFGTSLKGVSSHMPSSDTVFSHIALRTSTLAIVNIVPSPHSSHSSHSFDFAHSSQSMSRTVSAHFSSSTSIQNSFSSQAPLKNQTETASFTSVTLKSSSQSPSMSSSVLIPSPSSFAPTTSHQSSSLASPSSVKFRRIGGAVLGTIGALCLAFVLGGLLVWRYKRRRNISSQAVSSSPHNDGNRSSLTRSNRHSGSSPLFTVPSEKREMIYQGSRRFRFLQANIPRRPLTLSPPIKTSSYNTQIHFPLNNNVSSLKRLISSPLPLPPSPDQNLGTSLQPSQPQHFPSRTLSDVGSSDSATTNQVLKSSVDPTETSLPPREELPSSLIAGNRSRVPQITLEYTEIPSIERSSASPSPTLAETPKLARDATMPIGSIFLVPSIPRCALSEPTAAIPSPPSAPISAETVVSPAPLSTKSEKQQEMKDLEHGVLSTKRPSWASVFRTNLFHAVQLLNSTPEEDRRDCESDISSLYSGHSSIGSHTESGKSNTSTTATIPSEKKMPQKRTWVIVNGGAGPRTSIG